MGFTRAEISLKEKTLAFVMRHRVEQRAQGEVAVGREDEVVEDPAGKRLVRDVCELDDGADPWKLHELADTDHGHREECTLQAG